MTSTLPPDPYKCLGVSKDANLPEIRSAHRKLVLKCHPDKVQDAALKAIKQDEFQKVQQAYELLSDDTKRQQYDEQAKLFELRKEMGRGNPTPRSNPFEYEDRKADPASRPSSYGRPPPKGYSYQASGSRSHEDMMYDEPMRHIPRKSSSAEYGDRKRSSARESEREREHRRRDEDELRRSLEKEKRSHSDKKKSRDKEKRSRTEDKARARATGVYVEDDSSDEYPRPRSSGRKDRYKMEDHIRAAEEASRRDAENAKARAAIKEAPLAEKWDAYRDAAAKYMQSARRKEVEDEFTHPRMPQRSETFTGGSPSGSYNVRYAAPPAQFSDEDNHRRSSGRKSESRRTSETPPIRREKSRGDRRSPSHIKTDGFANIVEPPSPPPPARAPPPLQSYSSAPPVFSREKVSRSKTQDYPRKEKIPPLPRANTFNVDGRDRDRDRPRERGGSRLRNQYTDSSDDEEPVYSPRISSSPPPTMRTQKTHYVVQDNRAIPTPNTHRHRESHERYPPQERDQSPSPRIPATFYRTPPREIPTRSPPTYYPPPPDPIVMEAKPRPNMTARDVSSHRTANRNIPTQSSFPFDKVSYSPSYAHENIKFASIPVRSQEEYYCRSRGMEAPVYAT